VGLVVPRRIEGQVSEQLPVFGQDPHVEAIDEGEHPRADELPAQAEVVQPRVVAERDHPGDVELVPSHPVVRGDHEPRT
jgi:hypothetical protein